FSPASISAVAKTWPAFGVIVWPEKTICPVTGPFVHPPENSIFWTAASGQLFVKNSPKIVASGKRAVPRIVPRPGQATSAASFTSPAFPAQWNGSDVTRTDSFDKATATRQECSNWSAGDPLVSSANDLMS